MISEAGPSHITAAWLSHVRNAERPSRAHPVTMLPNVRARGNSLYPPLQIQAHIRGVDCDADHRRVMRGTNGKRAN